jgi:hypothetical protein
MFRKQHMVSQVITGEYLVVAKMHIISICGEDE